MQRSSRLFRKFGIESNSCDAGGTGDAVSRFWENPCRDTLGDVRWAANQTPEMMQAVIEKGAYPPFLDKVSKELLTYDVCLAACATCGLNIAYVPEELLDEKICRAAIENSPKMLGSIPEELRTVDICRLAVSHDPSGRALKSVPEKVLKGRSGSSICDSALKRAPRAIQYVPKELLTEDMMLDAVSRDAMTIGGLPEEMITKEMARIAAEGTRADQNSVSHILKEFLTQEVIERAETLASRDVMAIQPNSQASDSAISQDSLMIELKEDGAITRHELASLEEVGVEGVFYISDIHLCHQLDIKGKGPEAVRE